MTENFYTISKNFITLVIDGEILTINKEHKYFDKIYEELNKGNPDWEQIKTMANLKQSLLQYIGDNLKIVDNVFTYRHRGKILKLDNHTLVNRILDGMCSGKDYMPYVKFLDNLVKNPLKTAIEELYKFLEANELPITNDGYFLAYKRVNSNFKDYHTNTFDNSVGKIVSMPRREVEFNREVTCSRGLHFCSKSYLSCFGTDGDPIIVVKVNPKDVVSIPADYNNAKGRCCKYEVIGVLKDENQSLEDFLEKPKKEKTRKVKKEIMSKNPGIKKFSNKKSTKLDKDIPVYSTVEEARKKFKPRKVGDKLYVYKAKTNEYRLYQFIGGINNSNLKWVETH